MNVHNIDSMCHDENVEDGIENLDFALSCLIQINCVSSGCVVCFDFFDGREVAASAWEG
jgi:hypothetical protein